ncbi:hypothetical protein KP509_36G051200 [Ceratopteris richardii]|uniref:Growth-regulating factor n=1 Tax=Ceratopteris richardii TaxID=49495 RepID=A0A8T2QE93_CERRI|nr:hypothetical protein KP509_36G051200 [Ceratopteris richardii]
MLENENVLQRRAARVRGGLPLGMVSAGGSSNIQGLTEQELVMSMLQSSGRAFTPGQLRELQHQALVLKYITNGLNVPQDLVTPIRASLSGLSPAAAHLGNLPWGGYRLGFGANADPEPGRCRRTDGKKWRCSRDVVPDQKYCERHIHRGRHRTRKPMDSQQAVVAASSSPVCVSTSASGSASAVGSSAGILSTIGPASATVQPMTAGLTARHYSAGNSPTASCLSVGSSLTASHYNQLPSLHSPPGAGATMSSKDYRYISNMSRNDLDMGAEQMLFGEASGSSRGMGSSEYQGLHHQQSLAMLSSVSNSWRATPMQQSRAPSPSPSPHPSMKSNTSSPSIMQYSSPQIRTLLGQDFGSLSAETNSVNLQSNMVHHPQQQHQHSFLGGGFGSAEAVSTVGREPESQPLRHFFDDWPRSKDASALSWSDVEDDKPNRNSSTTQLSISIPVSSSEFNTSPPPGKLKLSPLKLSMSRAGEEDIPLGVELGVGMGLGVNEERHRQQQANWIPIAWETPMGGPLAEVLQSSTPRASKNSGLNLMTEGWGESPRDSPQLASSPREREVGGRATAVTVMDASLKGVE